MSSVTTFLLPQTQGQVASLGDSGELGMAGPERGQWLLADAAL